MQEENQTYNFSPLHPLPRTGEVLQSELLIRAEAVALVGGVIDGSAKGWSPPASTVPRLEVLHLGGSSGHAKLSVVGCATVHFLCALGTELQSKGTVPEE